jgi:hypothetical protein
MSKVILDPQLRAKLNGLHERLELCDEAGKSVGRFLPEDHYRQLVYTWANAQVTDEELQRAADEPGGNTLEDIWRRLAYTTREMRHFK